VIDYDLWEEQHWVTVTPGAEHQAMKDDARTLPFSTGCAHEILGAYKYGYRKTKLVCGDISTTYDFHRHNKAGMLLKTKGS